jgi:hypothetical protein
MVAIGGKIWIDEKGEARETKKKKKKEFNT